MGIAKIIADVVADNPHEVREGDGTGIEAALMQPKNGFLDGSGGTVVFMTAE
jgi:hypothetical protein